jgi:hypothetical protein
MERRERERIMRQGVVRPETPKERREREALQEDVADSPLGGRRIEQRLRNFKPSADSYLAALGGPLPYMTRLRAIHVQTGEHERQLEEAWRELADEADGDEAAFASRWRETAERWSFYEVNDLIARHNRWYPVEARLRMDPRTGDYALVNGEDYRRLPLDAAWVLQRFPPHLPRARARAA